MLRILTLALAFSGISTLAVAHPEPKTEAEASRTISKMERPQLPSKSKIQKALKQMPDMNAIMGDMMGIMKDGRFRDNMESSARAFGDRLESSGALETDKNGMPDFNSAFAVMLETFSDEDAMGGMLDTMMDLAETMEKHVPETSKTAEMPKLEELHKELKDLRAEVEELRKEKAPK